MQLIVRKNARFPFAQVKKENKFPTFTAMNHCRQLVKHL
jgi:hypothetical protein